MKKLNVMQAAAICMLVSPLALIALPFAAVIGGLFFIKRKVYGDL